MHQPVRWVSCGSDSLMPPQRRYSQFVELISHLLDNMSMLTVAELTADLELGLELVAGHSGAEREIEAAAVSELAHRARGCRAANFS